MASYPPARSLPKIWSDHETSRFLELMGSGDPDNGFFQKVKAKRVSRARAMREVAEALTAEGIAVTSSNCDNKWKTLLSTYRQVEDHNSKSGNDYKKESPFHQEMAAIIGDRASTRPKSLMGSGIPVPDLDLTDVVLQPSLSSLSSSSSSPPSTPCTPKHHHQATAAAAAATTAAAAACPGEKRARDIVSSDTDDDVQEVQEPDVQAAGEAKAAGVQKKKRKSSSRSRTNEVTSFLKTYSADQKAAESKKMEKVEEMHGEKVRLFERFLNIMEKKQ